MVVSRSLGDAHRDFSHAAAHIGIDDGRGSFLQNFLMAALDGALALAEINGVAMLVGQHLHLDVAGIDDGLLDVDFVVSEGALGLALSGLKGRLQFLRGVHQAHAFAAASGSRFQHYREADFFRDLPGLLSGFNSLRSARHEGNAGNFHVLAGAGLGAHHFHRGGGRSDELDTGVGAGLGEARVLREKSVTRMDGVSAADLGDSENFAEVQVRFARGGGPDVVSLVGLANMQRGAIDIGEDGDGGNAHLAASADDPDRYLSTIGNENLLEHAGRLRRKLELLIVQVVSADVGGHLARVSPPVSLPANH